MSTMTPIDHPIFLREHRGHETAHHRAMKRLIARLYLLLGWFVLIEKKLADVLAWRFRPNRRLFVLAVQAERSRRNAVRNANRDLRGGCDRVLVVATDEKLRAVINHQLDHHLSREARAKVGVTTIDKIERLITRLEAEALAKEIERNNGPIRSFNSSSHRCKSSLPLEP